MRYNYFSVYFTSGIPASPGFLRCRQHMHVITYYLGIILRFVYSATNGLWKFVFWERRKAGRSGPIFVVLHKSLFDVIPILPDLPWNFYRIFMLKQHPSTFRAWQSLWNHFPRTILDISCTYRAVEFWRLVFVFVSFPWHFVDSHISYIYILSLSYCVHKIANRFSSARPF